MTDINDIEQFVRRGQAAQEAVNALTPSQWTWTADRTWEIRGRDCYIWMQERPHYCDRGRWLAHVELLPGAHPRNLHIDNSDLWPRFFFSLDCAKSEVEAWLKARRQWIE